MSTVLRAFRLSIDVVKSCRALSAVLLALATLSAAPVAVALDDDQLPISTASSLHLKSNSSLSQNAARKRIGQAHANGGIQSIAALGGALISIPNWNGHYNARGVDQNNIPQNIWYYNMVGQRPEVGGTTTINAPVIAVSMDLRNFDGTPRYVNGQRLYYDATQYLAPMLGSPVFQNASYSSSPVPTQFTDAVQRAEFYHSAQNDWHTLLSPVVRTPRVMTLIRGTYRFALNADGTCCAFILVDGNVFVSALFPSTVPVDNTTVIGAAELAGDITPQDISTFVFPNTFLYSGTPANCCTVGFHSFDFEPGAGNSVEAFVMNYSSWVTPGLFGPAFQDVTALSHEMAETFNDPFIAADGVHNVTPWWLAPNGNCQDNLEVGDVVEDLPNATFPVTVNGHTYHPQNEALLPYFAFDPNPTSIGGAYSYPNTAVLSLPAPQNFNCQ